LSGGKGGLIGGIAKPMKSNQKNARGVRNLKADQNIHFRPLTARERREIKNVSSQLGAEQLSQVRTDKKTLDSSIFPKRTTRRLLRTRCDGFSNRRERLAEHSEL